MQQHITNYFGSPLILSHKTKLFANDVLFFEGDINYTWIHFQSGKQLVIAKTLMHVEGKTKPENFIRVSRKHLVNRQFIKQINRDCVVLSNKTVLPISRRRRGSVF